MKKIKVISLVSTISIMALIFFFSSQSGSESTQISSGATMKLVELVSPSLSPEQKMEIAVNIEYYVRKTAHFTVFAALGLSLITAIKSNFGVRNKKAIFLTEAICILYAVSDEFHQSFVGGRTMKFTDVLIDSAGALTGIILFFASYKIFYKFIQRMKKERCT